MLNSSDKARIAVFVSGGGTNLQALIDAQKSGKLHSGVIVLVISSNQSAFALKRAENAGIPSVVVSKASCTNQNDFEKNIITELDRYSVDFIVLAGFMSILSAEFVSLYPKRIINVHPSLIPSFCGKGYYGLKVHEAALARGVKVTGATVHFVNEIPDGGEIILQKAVKILKTDTPEALQKRVMASAEHILLPRAAEAVSREIIKNRSK